MKRLVGVIADAMVLGGAAGLSYGAWLAWPPAGFMVAGVASLALGLALERAVR